jgi:hypothetical protein
MFWRYSASLAVITLKPRPAADHCHQLSPSGLRTRLTGPHMARRRALDAAILRRSSHIRRCGSRVPPFGAGVCASARGDTAKGSL